MIYKTKYTKEEAIVVANSFIEELRILEEKHSMSVNADEDIYLSFQSSKTNEHWGYVKIGWEGDGTGLKVLDNVKKEKINKALSKLSDEEKELLGLNQ